MSRYNRTKKIINNSQSYRYLFDRKKINFIPQYSTFNFNNLKNFTDYNLDFIYHKVEPFDKLYNISQKYYSSPDYGWLICYTNKISNELEIKIGDSLMIFFPLDTLLGLL